MNLRGRAKGITFHVFDPRVVERILNEEGVAGWREEDAERAAENRRRAAWKAKLTRLKKRAKELPTSVGAQGDPERFNLKGWDEFEREQLLR